MDGLTRQIAAFVAGEAPAHASRRAVEAAVTGMLDCIGVAIAGCDEPAPRLVGQIVAERQGEDAAPVLPTGSNARTGRRGARQRRGGPCPRL